MLEANDSTETTEPSQAMHLLNPNQFGLSDLFALVTLASMLCAIFIPAARAMLDGAGFVAVFYLTVQFALTAGCGYWVVKQRTRCLQLGGARLGAGFCGVIRWTLWPRLLSWIQMILISSFQLGLSLLIASAPLLLINIQLLFAQTQLAFFTSRSFLCFWSRVYPNSIEFFEQGIVLYGSWFLTWNQVSVRPSTLYPDRIVVIYQMHPERQSGNLCVVQVSDELRRNVLNASTRTLKSAQSNG